MSEDGPKSALEIAMERLARKDKEAGVSAPPIAEEQKAAIAELRRVYEAKLAEIEILHQSKLRRLADPDARGLVEEDYQREREHLTAERDRKLAELRSRASAS